MAGQSNQFTPITFSAVLPLKNGIFIVNMPPPHSFEISMTIALILQRGCLEVAAPGQKKKSDIVLSNFRESWVFRPRSIIMRFWEFSYFQVRIG